MGVGVYRTCMYINNEVKGKTSQFAWQLKAAAELRFISVWYVQKAWIKTLDL